MPDYQKGKIYKMWDNNYTECYVGSTIQDLSVRMAEHRKRYKQFKNGLRDRPETTVSKLFDKYGLENCRIELEELFPCNSKMELDKREGEYIRTCKCVNKLITGRTRQEWMEENKEYLQERRQKHYQENKETINSNRRLRREENKDEINKEQREKYKQNKDQKLEWNRKYRNANKDKIKARKARTYNCPCGSISTIEHKARHERTLKHQQYLNSLSQEESPITP